LHVRGILRAVILHTPQILILFESAGLTGKGFKMSWDFSF
jgi:hypothetical protein